LSLGPSRGSRLKLAPAGTSPSLNPYRCFSSSLILFFPPTFLPSVYLKFLFHFVAPSFPPPPPRCPQNFALLVHPLFFQVGAPSFPLASVLFKSCIFFPRDGFFSSFLSQQECQAGLCFSFLRTFHPSSLPRFLLAYQCLFSNPSPDVSSAPEILFPTVSFFFFTFPAWPYGTPSPDASRIAFCRLPYSSPIHLRKSGSLPGLAGARGRLTPRLLATVIESPPPPNLRMEPFLPKSGLLLPRYYSFS